MLCIKIDLRIPPGKVRPALNSTNYVSILNSHFCHLQMCVSFLCDNLKWQHQVPIVLIEISCLGICISKNAFTAKLKHVSSQIYNCIRYFENKRVDIFILIF